VYSVKGLTASSSRGPALSDSSNSLSKRRSNNKSGGSGSSNSSSVDDFQFKKPLSRPKLKAFGPIKTTHQSLSTDSTTPEGKKNLKGFNNNNINRKSRSHSVPNNKETFGNDENAMLVFGSSFAFGKLSAEEEDLYPEPEIFRQIFESEDFLESPMIHLRNDDEEEGDVFMEGGGGADQTLISVHENEIVEQEEEDDDDEYPEIEKLPMGYAAKVLIESPYNGMKL
jgi:hypothetical protein